MTDQVKLDRRACKKAQIAETQFQLAVTQAEVFLWRKGLQQQIQAAKENRDAVIRDIARLAGINAEEYQFDIDNGVAVKK